MSFLDSLLGGIKAVLSNGTLQPQEPGINFTGSGVTVADDSVNGFTTVTIPGVAGEGAFINVKTTPYNAQGNGIANDTGSILSAIAAAGMGGIVYFPPGIYMVDPIDFNAIPTVGRADGVILQGSGQGMPGLIASSGTILKARASQEYVIKVAALNVQLRDMCIDGNFLTTTAALRFEYFTNNATIRNVNVTRTLSWNGSTGGDLVGFDYDGNNLEIDNVRFENCTFQQDAANGLAQSRFCVNVVGTNVFENTFSNCRFLQGFVLIGFNGGSASFIDNCQFYSHGTGGVRIAGGGAQMCRFEDCYSEFASGNFLFYVDVVSTSNVPITFKNCEFNANIQLNFECSQPTILIGNLFKGNVNLAANAFSSMPVVSVGNSFLGAAFAGAGLKNLVEIGDVGLADVPINQVGSSFNVQSFGAKGDGTTDDSTAIGAAITAAADRALYFPKGNYKISNNVTGTSGQTWIFERGAIFSIDNTKVLTVPAVDVATDQQIFSGLGTVHFLSGGTSLVYPDWWGTGTGAVQAAIDAASAKGITVRLRAATQYAIGTTGLTVTNPNTSIVGDGEVGDATTAVTGAEIYYTGTGTAILVGNGSTTTYIENVRLENFAIKTNDGCTLALSAWAPADSLFHKLTIFGPSANTSYCLKISQAINTVFSKLKVNGTGRAGTATEGNYANGISVLPVSGSPTTSTVLRDTYIHGCFVGLTADTTIMGVESTIFETSVVGYAIQNSSSVEFLFCHFEDVGFSGAGVGAGEQFHGTTVKIDSCEIIMTAGTTVVFSVQGASGGAILTLVNNRYSTVDPAVLFDSSVTTNGAKIVLLDVPNFNGGTWTLTNNAGATGGHSPNWRQCLISGMHVVKYSFHMNSVAANITAAQVFSDIGLTNWFSSGDGYVLGMSYIYSAPITAGSIDVKGKINGTTEFDTNASSSQFLSIDHDSLANAIVSGDALSVTVDTTAGFLPTGGDLIVELYVGYVR